MERRMSVATRAIQIITKCIQMLLFVEIIFRVWTIIFRGIFLCKMQNGHSLTHLFSL